MKTYYPHTKWSKLFDIVNVIFMCIFMFIVLYPLYNQFLISINDGSKTAISQIGFWPQYITLDAYKEIFKESAVYRGFFISVLRIVIGTSTTLFCTGLLAYMTTIKRFKARHLLRRLFIFTMYFGGGLIPTYLLMINLNLLESFWVYIIPGMFSAYYMLIIASYIQGLPDALIEAARVDGCSEFGIYTKIILPCCVPVFAAVAVYLAVGHWNSWFDVLIYNPSGTWDTLQVYLRRVLLEAEAFNKIQDASLQGQLARNLTTESLKSAITVVVTIPILVVYPFFQKYFISGITIGSVK